MSLSTKNAKKITAPNYLGSKLRMMDDILPILTDETNEGEWVCDLFSGSGIVTAALSNYRSVISVDIQNYSNEFINGFSSPLITLNAEAFLNDIGQEFKRLCLLVPDLLQYEDRLLNDSETIFELANFIENASFIRYSHKDFSSKSENLDQIMLDAISILGDNGVKAEDIIATWNFGGVYFSFKQSLFIDSILNTIKRQNLENIKSTVLALACTLVNTIGKQFAQPLSPWDKNGNPKKSLFKKANSDRGLSAKDVYISIMEDYLNQTPSQYNVQSWCMDFKDALNSLPSQVTMVYADPPYTRDHYSRFYHVLETLSLGDIPEVSTVKVRDKISISKGLYRKDRHQSAFCIKSQAFDAFDDLFRIASEKQIKVLLSYSPFENEEHPRVMKVEEIIKIASKYFDNFEETIVTKLKHNKLNSNSNHLNRGLPAELLLLFTNPKG
ncbi:DNA adenine methylase [Psychrobacter sp. DM4]|uniref:DNA adenine methylase n=1 Tax=Psychrobacter sp. DM4 TaxID=3440637 RepID=UPI003F5000E1